MVVAKNISKTVDARVPKNTSGVTGWPPSRPLRVNQGKDCIKLFTIMYFFCGKFQPNRLNIWKRVICMPLKILHLSGRPMELYCQSLKPAFHTSWKGPSPRPSTPLWDRGRAPTVKMASTLARALPAEAYSQEEALKIKHTVVFRHLLRSGMSNGAILAPVDVP